MRILASALFVLGLGCAEYRAFPCHRCSSFIHFGGPGEAPCRECGQVNLAATCPSCGTVSDQPGYGPVRCDSCRSEFHAWKCRSCSASCFAKDPGTPCSVCAARLPSPPATAEGARAARIRGDEAAGRAEWERAVEAYEECVRLDPRDASARYALACVLSRSGNQDRAIVELERAVAGGFSNWELLRKDADLEAVRTHPRYRALLEKAPR